MIALTRPLIEKILSATIVTALIGFPKAYCSFNGVVEARSSSRNPSIILPRTNGFPGKAPVPRKAQKSTSRLPATIEFTGESTTTIDVPPPSNFQDKTSLSAWMLSSDSDPFFLGTSSFKQRQDGWWDAYQPSVDWFGVQLQPVFVIELKRSNTNQEVAALIQEARSDIQSENDGSPMGKLIKKVMGQSTFRGANTVAWKETEADAKSGWTLRADLSLTVIIPLPPFVPLPPGFNSIGSRIVKSTCRKRLEQFVHNLQGAYLSWATEQTQHDGEDVP